MELQFYFMWCIMLKIIRETNKYLICRCPSGKHEDKTPSFHILKCDWRGHKKGCGYCFACGHSVQYSGEFVNKMSKKKTKRFRKKSLINWAELTLKYHRDLPINNLPVNLSLPTCHLYLVGWDGEAWTIPFFDENYIPIGIQRRFPDSFKVCVEESQLGIFIPGEYRGQKVVVAEGFTDSAIATECGFYGLGLPSAIYGNDIIVKFLINHKINTVTIVSDNDGVGRENSLKLSKILRTNSIDNRILIPEPYKDLRQKYENDGKTSVTNFLKGIK